MPRNWPFSRPCPGESKEALTALKERFSSLSPREREIMIEVARGRLRKQIAGDIGIAERP
jgi:FixJ family two-component response regulator